MSSARIIEIHLNEAAFLWALRDRATRDAAYDLRALAELDARVDAHLDGLVLAGSEGALAIARALEEPEPGIVFAALFVAVSCRGGASLADACRRGAAVGDVLELATSSPAMLHAATAALGWLPPSHFMWLLPCLLDPGVHAERRHLGIAGAAAHRHDPGDAVIRACEAREPALRARAIRACGELGRSDVELGESLAADDAAVRFWAAWAGALRRDPRAIEVLFAFAAGDGPFAERACATAMRAAAPSVARRWLESLAASGQLRKALLGAAELGDPALVPWALELMATPELARIAAETVRRITGIDCESRALGGRAPQGFRAGPNDDPADENVAMDPDESLPWPNPTAVDAQWRASRDGFAPGTRHLMGRPLTTPDWLAHLLWHARQPVRAAAAEELALEVGRGPLFEVRARALRQRKELSRWSS